MGADPLVVPTYRTVIPKADPETLEDDDEIRRLYIDQWLGSNPEYNSERLALEHVYARRAVLREWLREKGYDPLLTSHLLLLRLQLPTFVRAVLLELALIEALDKS